MKVTASEYTPSYSAVARRRRRASVGVFSGTNSGDGWRRLAEDEKVLEAATLLGVISLRQAHRYIYDLTFTSTRKRLARMVDVGLLVRLDNLNWAGAIYYPTRAGRKAILEEDSPLLALEPPAESTMLHRLIVAEEALKLLSAGKTIITEREARLYEMGTTPENIEDRDYFLERKGVKRSINNSPGVVPTKQSTNYGVVDRYLLVPTRGGESHYRIPDLFEVTDTGELRAIEVELTPKRPARLRGILKGYRDACLAHNQEPRGTSRTLKEVGPVFRQLAGVKWVGTEPVINMIRGPEGEVNSFSGKKDIGIVRPLWESSLNTHLFYASPSSWPMVREAWPVSVNVLDLSYDPGLEYALEQMTMPVNLRHSFNQWAKWRKIWMKEMDGDKETIPFTKWIRLPGNFQKAQQS